MQQQLKPEAQEAQGVYSIPFELGDPASFGTARTELKRALEAGWRAIHFQQKASRAQPRGQDLTALAQLAKTASNAGATVALADATPALHMAVWLAGLEWLLPEGTSRVKTLRELRSLPLGEILVSLGHLKRELLQEAIKEQEENEHERLGETIERRGFSKRDQVLEAVACQLEVPYVPLRPDLVDPDAFDLVPREMVEEHYALPLFQVGSKVVMAMADPSNFDLVEELEQEVGAEVVPVLCDQSAILDCFAVVAEKSSHGGLAFDTLEQAQGEGLVFEDTDAEGDDLLAGGVDEAEFGNKAPIVRFVNSLIFKAIKEGASDIHIEPYQDILRVRFRYDGVLTEVIRPPRNLLAPIVSRIKMMGSMDIGERRLPQDGRIQVNIASRRVDLRVSVLPTFYGEKVCMRVLDRDQSLLRLEACGMSDQQCDQMRRAIRRPEGFVLVTGPTGSGKTTTLYACLNEINDFRVNISTVEDPIEYNMQFVNQVQVNSKIGLTFASVLRSLLRQDPEIVLVGEIRDLETASIAVQASLTGHLVLSTLHTRDAVGVISRLLNMGVDCFLVSSAVSAMQAQRLVRKICPACVEEVEAEPRLRSIMRASRGVDLERHHQGMGCPECHQTGYKGRQAIFEIIEVDEELRELILKQPSTIELRKWLGEHNVPLMFEDGMQKVHRGITTPAEVLRVLDYSAT